MVNWAIVQQQVRSSELNCGSRSGTSLRKKLLLAPRRSQQAHEPQKTVRPLKWLLKYLFPNLPYENMRPQYVAINLPAFIFTQVRPVFIFLSFHHYRESLWPEHCGNGV